MNKTESQRIHATRRAKKRYRLHLKVTDIQKIVNNIQTGIAIFLKRESRRISVFITYFNTTPVKVVYDKFRHNIVTFLHIKKNEARQFYDKFRSHMVYIRP